MPQRITMLLDDLLGGGTARVVSHLSNAWVDQGRSVTILTMDDGRSKPFYTQNPSARHEPLDLRGNSSHAFVGLVRNIRRLIRLRRALRASHPDVIISFLDRNNVLCLLATRGLRNVPILVSERTDPFERPLGFVWERLRRLTYPWADCVVTQSSHALSYFSPKVQAKGRVIPNPVLPLPAPIPLPGHQAGRRYLAVTLGRLNKVKGHDLLVDAFATMAAKCPEWDLAIYGDGEEREALTARIRAYGLENRISLKGITDQPGACLREADLFVLPSRVEGFPNALAEAMACGLPVVSFRCRSGPSELIRDGVDGLLVPPSDVSAMALALTGLMNSPQERARLSARAPEVLARFALKRILELWEEAIPKRRSADFDLFVVSQGTVDEVQS